MGTLEDCFCDFFACCRTNLKLLFRNVEKSSIMGLGQNKSVSRIDWINIKKADDSFIFVDFGAWKLAFYNMAKNAIGHSHSPRVIEFAGSKLIRKIRLEPASMDVGTVAKKLFAVKPHVGFQDK